MVTFWYLSKSIDIYKRLHLQQEIKGQNGEYNKTPYSTKKANEIKKKQQCFFQAE